MAEEKKTLVLIDASALIYRAYYALPPLTTKDGFLVNAAYGFTSALFNAIRTLKPTHIVVAFDSKPPTFRHKEFKEYKATRPKAPAEMVAQLPFVREICKALNIPILEKPGFEADDIIGTIVNKIRNPKLEILNPDGFYPIEDPRQSRDKSKIQNPKSKTARQCNNATMKTIIVTGDMDTLQLVDDNTKVYSMARGIQRAEIYDEDKIKEKYGFGPKGIIEYKALRGDPSDNIPGVAGIGEKTATNLIKEFVSLDNLYNKITAAAGQKLIDDIALKKTTINLLIKYEDIARLSKRLATIVRDVPIIFNLSDCLVHDYDRDKAEKLFRKLEFKSLIKRLPWSQQSEKQGKLF